MTDQTTAPPKYPTCSKCGEKPAGPGGILCPACLTAIKAVRLPD
ncbi:hypothetical protein [Amycolatopsis eburnea]|nr:hypothetical protein [Amycolatopsis eburnea]